MPWTEIDYHNEIKILNEIGSGTFGAVSKALWKNKFVALKFILNDRKNDFLQELKQLARLSHPGIVTLYGACTKHHLCLVMEYASAGSLSYLLHDKKMRSVTYSTYRALSWALQIANAVAYLHAAQPKAIIHRDLKPLNILLFDSGRVVKICDFGTSCEAHTLMTNNTGSALWMAPEVFKGTEYDEKADVYSFGVIFWEILSRRKPYNQIANAYSILFRVTSSGMRPKLLSLCPEPIQRIFTSSWLMNSSDRPSMSDIVRVLTVIMRAFTVDNSPVLSEETETSTPSIETKGSVASYRFLLGLSNDNVSPIITKPIIKVNHAPSKVAMRNNAVRPSHRNRFSADAAQILNGQNNDVVDRQILNAGPQNQSLQKHGSTSAEGSGTSFKKSHKRCGSQPLLDNFVEITSNEVPYIKVNDVIGSSYPNSLYSQPDVFPTPVSSTVAPDMMTNERYFMEISYQQLMRSLVPIEPYCGNPESLQVYNNFMRLAEDYRGVYLDIMALDKEKSDLTNWLANNSFETQPQTEIYKKCLQISKENDDLESTLQNLKNTLYAG